MKRREFIDFAQCVARVPAESQMTWLPGSIQPGRRTNAGAEQRPALGQDEELRNDVAIVIPVLNEAAVMPRLLRLLGILDPVPAEIIAVDGGSQDNTAALVRQSGFVRLIEHAVRGRPAAINRGVIEACSPIICVLHADTILPDDAVAVIRATMEDPRIALA